MHGILPSATNYMMIEKLFVYGTLGPGRPNEHILTIIGGSWQPATITGDLRAEGWGAKMGYPGIRLNEHGGKIEGFVFSSEFFSRHWARLDAFEGDGYCRILTKVQIKSGDMIDAYVYTLP